ncbi:hypothetical protein [Alloactinosynnema sp. L-07]|nr:hypothetical protein [Alloactinosynnema sp. L-07]
MTVHIRSSPSIVPANAEIVRAHYIAWPHPEAFPDTEFPALT